jgi:hypothetical protein
MNKRKLLRPKNAKSSQVARRPGGNHYVVHYDDKGLEILAVLWLLDVLQFNQVDWESSEEYVEVEQYEADDDGNLVETTSTVEVVEEEVVAVAETPVEEPVVEPEPVNVPVEEPAPAPEPEPEPAPSYDGGSSYGGGSDGGSYDSGE